MTADDGRVDRVWIDPPCRRCGHDADQHPDGGGCTGQMLALLNRSVSGLTADGEPVLDPTFGREPCDCPGFVLPGETSRGPLP